MAYIQRITVPCGNSVNIDISDEHNTLPAENNFAGTALAVQGDMVLYDRNVGTGVDGEKVYACIWNTSAVENSPILQVEVGGIPDRVRGAQAKILMDCGSDYIIESDAQQVKQSTMTFDLTRKIVRDEISGAEEVHVYDLHEAPFGIWGKVRFYSSITGEYGFSTDEEKAFVENITLEFYCLSSECLPYVFKDGIPLSLLRMFLLAIPGKQRPKTTQEWIAHVVGIVHGSRAPFTGLKSETADHWLRYDTWHGGTSFASPWGGVGLNIRAWLDSYYNWKMHGEPTLINCYDQAAITEVALALGMPHHQVHWEYHKVYGFIKETQLVGWGVCNNPYFEDDSTQMNLSDLKDRRRQPFNNHAYLSWTSRPLSNKDYVKYNTRMNSAKTYENYRDIAQKFEDELNITMLMIDSCAGPHAGTESRKDYESMNERITDKASSFSDGVKNSTGSWSEEHYLGPGITQGNPATTLLKLLAPADATLYQDESTRISNLLVKTGLGSANSTITIEQLHKAFERTFDDLAQQNKWTNPLWVTIRPYKSNTGSTIGESKVYFGVGEKNRVSLSLRMTVSGSPKETLDQLAAHLAFDELVNKYGPNVVKWVTDESGMTVVGRPQGWLRAFAWKNIACELSGWVDNLAAYDVIAQALAKLLSS